VSVRDGIDIAGDRLRTFIEGMAPRERFLVGFTLVVVFCFVAWFSVGAMNKATDKVKRQIVAASTAQAQVDGLLAQYSDLSSQVQALDARLEAGRDFAPLTWIETVGNEMGISDQIRSVNERGTEETDYYIAQKFDLRVDDIDLRQVTDLVFRLESAPQAIWVNECRVKTDRKNRAQLDVNMEISILKPIEGGA
jgi:hypothetical protein